MEVTSPSVSFIIPTIARHLLLRVLGEIRPQLGAMDEILVIGDGPFPVARKMVDGLSDPRIKYLEHGPAKNWGHSQRNFAMPLCKGQYIMTLDDDDRFSSKGLATIREVASHHPGRPLMFRLMHDTGVIWEKPIIRQANVSTQMFVVPNDPTMLGIWGNRYEGDLDFIESTVARYPKDALVWREEMLVLRGVSHNPEWNERMALWKW